MLNTFRIPKCYNTFKAWVTSKYQFTEIYKQIGSPRPTDVTFREGIISLAEEERRMFSIADYDTLFKTIAHMHKPKDFRVRNYLLYDEVDFKNNVNMYHNNVNYLKKYLKLHANINIAINNSDNLKEYFKHGIYNYTIPLVSYENFSFDPAEILNTHMEMTEPLKNINNINLAIFGNHSAYVINLVTNKYYKNISSVTLFERDHRDELHNTLSDLKHFMNINKVNLNIQHHGSQKKDTIEFIHRCLDLGIHNFEVSYFKTSGSTNLLVNPNKQHSVITYDLYYEAIATYILQKVYGTNFETGLVDI
jgi:hypothetical protein